LNERPSFEEGFVLTEFCLVKDFATALIADDPDIEITMLRVKLLQFLDQIFDFHVVAPTLFFRSSQARYTTSTGVLALKNP